MSPCSAPAVKPLPTSSSVSCAALRLVAVKTSACSTSTSRSSESSMRPLCAALSAISACCVMSGLVSSRRFDLDPLRVARHAAGEVADHAGERRREEQRLPLLGRLRHDRVELFLEAHVEHAVGFIQHEDLHAAQLHAAAVHVVLEAARRRDHDVHAPLHLLELRAEGHSAHQARRHQLLAAAVAVRRLLHLHRQLARRAEHQHARAMARPRRRGAQALQGGQHERRRLAAPGLGGHEQIRARQHRRESLPAAPGSARHSRGG